MGRFRWIFLAFAVAVLVPVAILVERALESVRLERDLRHRTLAERVFDEMERALSQLLEAEESRPNEGLGASTPEADPPFVLGRFEAEPGGAVHTAGRRAGASEIERVARESGRDGRRNELARTTQSPGTTVELGAKKSREEKEARVGDERDGAEALSAYDALRSLNKAVEDRSRRQALGAAAKSEAANAADAFAAPRPESPALLPPTEIHVAPLTGRSVDATRFVLERTVLRGAGAVRQGLVIDVPALGEWLRGIALGTEELAGLGRVAFATPHAPAPAPSTGDGAYVYRHRFGEPFADLTARLVLGALPGLATLGYVYALSAILALTVAVGLLAIDRMVSARVAFAERRQNFVAAGSHELKTPLTAIRMYGEMLRDGMVSAPEKRAEYYRHITAESERLSRLINNVLELSRLERGERPLALTTAPLGPAVEEAAALVRPHVEASGFELRVAVAPDLQSVRFERDALTQVLFNLVDNAVKYAGESSPRRIDVDVDREGGAVVLAVRDHGPGVAPRHLARVFEPFYRGESELTRRSRGTGIGLALVRGLTERMGARAQARNAPGGGFEVRIAFG